MSWLFSQALVAEYLADICSDGEPFAPSSGNPTQRAYCAPDRMTAFSRLSRFGMTYKPLTEDRGAELLTSYLADFRARTSAPQGGGRASTESAAACGATWPALSVKFCLGTSSWKTAHCLWEEVLPWSSVTLPRWGMTRTGAVFQHPTLERPISGTGSGSSETYPTPNCYDAIPDYGNRKDSNLENGGRHGVSLRHLVKTWPTPKANDAEKRGNFDVKNPRNGLPAAAKRWPTPVASMHKGSTPAALTRKDGQDRSNDRLDHAVMASDGGQLNPTWVEWLMGWPLGWTDLKPLATDKFREWQQQHGRS